MGSPMCLTMDQILVKSVHNKCITILERKELMDLSFCSFSSFVSWKGIEKFQDFYIMYDMRYVNLINIIIIYGAYQMSPFFLVLPLLEWLYNKLRYYSRAKIIQFYNFSFTFEEYCRCLKRYAHFLVQHHFVQIS